MKLRDPILRAPSALLLAAILLSPACTREEAEDKAKELADKAGDKGKELAGQAGDKGKELADKAGDKG
ncbi:MAG: hypothetical protein KC457_15555, partial [Myxococcales bacterium]|nr:hypothetical protein [Myxococcales bacterium]